MNYKLKVNFKSGSIGFIKIYTNSQGINQYLGIYPVLIDKECQNGKAVVVYSIGPFESTMFPVDKSDIYELE